MKKLLHIQCLAKLSGVQKISKAVLEIYQFCKKNGYDIVHTHSSKHGAVGRIGAIDLEDAV